MRKVTTAFQLVSLLALLPLLLGCPPRQGDVYVAFGQHVDFYHSYRGDSPTEDGFGMDIEVITQTLDYLEKHPRVKMSWEFDSWQTLEQRLPVYAPELFDRIKARVAEKDEVRFQSWNGGVVSAETPEEFAAGIRWQRDNLMRIFGKVENGVYPQEMMHTPSLIRPYGDLGMQWVSLFYSACSFTAFRNEVDLSPREQYNPLWLETPEGDARMILLPTYHHADVADFVGLATWADYVSRRVAGDSLIFIAFDADASSWPLVLKLLLPGLEKLDFVHFCTPGEYLASHEPVGTVALQRDQADGAFDGYSSWAEKPINHDIWTAVEASRAGERRTRFLTDLAGFDPPGVEGLLEENFRERMETMKTTHFGLATPFLHPDRVRTAYDHADDIRGLAGQALALAEAAAAPAMRALAATPPVLPFPGASRPYYVYRPEDFGALSLARIPLRFSAGESRSGGIRVFQVVGGVTEEVPSGLLDVDLHPDGSVREATLAFQLYLSPHKGKVVWVSRSASPLATEPDYGLVANEGDRLLRNGLVRVDFDAHGWPASLWRSGTDFCGERLIRPGITFQDGFAGPETLEVADLSATVRERGFFRQIARTGAFQVSCGGSGFPGSVEYRFRVYPRLASLEVQATVTYPATLDACPEAVSEAYPLGVLPDLSAETLMVWKHNYFDYTGSYEVTEPQDSLNSHVTASWVALSDRTRGLLVACRADELAGLAFCPLKVKEGLSGGLEAVMNPFGSCYGQAPDHHPERTGASGLGEAMTVLVGEQFKPSARAYPGVTQRFSVLLTPYVGDAPPDAARRGAQAYSWPPGVAEVPQ